MRSESRGGRSPERISHRGPVQNVSSAGGPPRLLCSRALIRDLAVAVLCRKRNDSFPVSTIWQMRISRHRDR